MSDKSQLTTTNMETKSTKSKYGSEASSTTGITSHIPSYAAEVQSNRGGKPEVNGDSSSSTRY